MLLSDIKLKIGRRVADPLLDTYADVVQDYFEQAFTTLIKKRNEGSILPYYENEILPLLNTETHTITTINRLGDFDIGEISNILYPYDVSVMTDFLVNYRYISMQELNDKIHNPNLFPSTNEGYWTKLGEKIRILTSITYRAIPTQISVVKNPNVSEWGDGDVDLDYGIGFLYDTIELASSLLRRQIGMEG